MPALNIIVLRDLLQRVPPRLRGISNEVAETKPSPSAWSRKEELGHLLDSAANNHQRIVRAQFENGLAMPGYEQNRWVSVHGYQRRDWSELIDTWQALNRQLLAAAEAIPDAAWSHTLTVASVRFRRLRGPHAAPPEAHRNRRERFKIKCTAAR
jgi:hypothetical protein